MRRVFFSALMMVLGGACTLSRLDWRKVDARADQAALRSLETGDVIGFIEPEGTVAWLGIPYAEPPVGPLRWKAPLPAKKRDVFVFSATKYGNECPQVTSDGGVEGDESCLTLNISARSLTEERQPVMVWIHGGDASGTANLYGVMRNISRRYGIVVVSVNYRLGVLGSFHHPALLSALDSPDDASGNYGTLDQITALEWVRDNILKFGGDPTNVTVFGEGSGGSSVFALLTSPRAKGLFHRAAIQSGAPVSTTFDDGFNLDRPNSSSEVVLQQLMFDQRAGDREAAKTLLASLRESDVANYLRSRTPQQLLTPLGTNSVPRWFRDGHVLPATPMLEALAQGPQVPVLLSVNRDANAPDAKFLSSLTKETKVDAPADALRRAGAPTFLARFDWDAATHPVENEPAPVAEGADVGFVLGDEAGEIDFLHRYTDENEVSRVKLSRAMMSYWVQFARTGAPGRGVEGDRLAWPVSTDAHEFMIFDATPRVDAGRETVEQLEQRLWSSTEFSDDAERCAAVRRVLVAGGAWSSERAARHAQRCH